MNVHRSCGEAAKRMEPPPSSRTKVQFADDAVITSARVDKGPVLKRFTPRARGSASPKHKPTAHIMIEVAAAEKGEK